MRRLSKMYRASLPFKMTKVTRELRRSLACLLGSVESLKEPPNGSTQLRSERNELHRKTWQSTEVIGGMEANRKQVNSF